MSQEPPSDPADLAGFPTYELDPSRSNFRLHHVNRNPAWFRSDGFGRFDPPPGSRHEYGTCYLAELRIGAFVEKFGRLETVSLYLVEETRLSELKTAQALSLADITDRKVLGSFGITADLGAGGAYDLPQLWGKALRASGYDGIRYYARHDPAQQLVSFALFGGPEVDVSRFQPPKPTTVPPELIEEAREQFGIFVVGQTLL